jgi:hypothetical protein
MELLPPPTITALDDERKCTEPSLDVNDPFLRAARDNNLDVVLAMLLFYLGRL